MNNKDKRQVINEIKAIYKEFEVFVNNIKYARKYAYWDIFVFKNGKEVFCLKKPKMNRDVFIEKYGYNDIKKFKKQAKTELKHYVDNKLLFAK